MRINLFLYVFVGCIAISSCKDSEEKVDMTDFCNSMCDKYIECYPAGGGSFPWTWSNDEIMFRTECIDRCNARAPHMLDAWMKSIAECIEVHSCKEMESRDPECVDNAENVCSTDMTPLIIKCERDYECSGETPTQEEIDSCVSWYLNEDEAQILCYNAAARSRFLSCISEVCFDSQYQCYAGGELF